MNSGFIGFIPGGASWLCQPHEAVAVQIGLPEAAKTKSKTELQNDQVPSLKPKTSFREAMLDSSQLTELVAWGMSWPQRATSRCGSGWRSSSLMGEIAAPDVAAKLANTLDKLGVAGV